MTESCLQSMDKAPCCYRHPTKAAEQTIDGIPMCSDCLVQEAQRKKSSVRKAVKTRRSNQANRRLQGNPNSYSEWQAAFQKQLNEKRNQHIRQLLERNEIGVHSDELRGRLYQYCTGVPTTEKATAHLRGIATRTAQKLRAAAGELAKIRGDENLLSRWHSYVLDEIARRPEISSKAGEWQIPEWRGQRGRLEPECLRDEAHDLSALAAALSSINKSVVKQGDGQLAPILVYLSLYLEKLLPVGSAHESLAQLVNIGLAAAGKRASIKSNLLRKQVREYKARHPITVHQLQLRARVLIEGTDILLDPATRAYTYDSEPVVLPNGKHSLLPMCAVLPALP